MERLIFAFALLSFAHALPSLLSIASNTTALPVTFVTVETRGQPWLSKIGHFPEPVINAAIGQALPNIGVYHLKIKILIRWLETQPATQLVAFVDGDVFWGGCSLEEFVGAYNDIVRQTGAKVVFGAEMSCTDQDCRKVPSIPSYAQWRTRDWAQFAECPASWDEKCAQSRSCLACSDPPAPMFLNSGFFMGPAGHLLKMTLMANSHGNWEQKGIQGDQGIFAEYWLQHPDVVTLDYETRLVMNMAYLASNATSLNTTTGTVLNQARNHIACFVHGNGPSKTRVKKLIQDMGYDADGIQVSHNWPSLTQVAEQGIHADGSLSNIKVASAHPDEQPTRRMVMRHEPSITANGKAMEEPLEQNKAGILDVATYDIRTEEGARLRWRGK